MGCGHLLMAQSSKRLFNYELFFVFSDLKKIVFLSAYREFHF